MILTGREIERQVELGAITIDPFDCAQLNPNSYNYRLGSGFTVGTRTSSGASSSMPPLEEMSPQGFLLQPKVVYLGHTLETIGSSVFVPSLIGRSSLGRMGLFLQISADLGNLGGAHRWTLELCCVQPIRIYPEMIVGQVSFWASVGARTRYKGDYVNYSVPVGNLDPDLVGQ